MFFLGCMRGSLSEKRSDYMERFSRISHDINIMGGKPCIVGTRITVGAILMHISEGISNDELLVEYPHLTSEDINFVRDCM